MLEAVQLKLPLDIGKIFEEQNSVDIPEIEFELKQGSIEDLIAFIQLLDSKIPTGSLEHTHSKSDDGLQADPSAKFLFCAVSNTSCTEQKSSEVEALKAYWPIA